MKEPPLDDQADFFRQAKAAQRQTKRLAFSDTAFVPPEITDLIADMRAQQANLNQAVIAHLAPRAAAPSTGALPVNPWLRS